MMALKNEFMMNLQSAYSYLGGLSYTAEEALKPNVMINALNDSASENALKYNAEATKFKSLDVSDTNFTKDDLMQSYANKRAETEAKMANTGNKIVQEQQRIRNEKEKSSKKFDDDKNKVSTKI